MIGIEIKQLQKSFKKNHVLRGIDLTFDKPGIYAVLGPNASGKTTLIKSILGMVIPQKGEIFFMGENIKNNHLYREKLSYLPQIARFPENLRVAELFEMIQNLRNRKGEIDELIEAFSLAPHLNSKLASLSGGTKQKVNVILTFMYDNPIIILDEPTTGLDPVSLVFLKKLIQKEKAKGKIILVTTHIMQIVEDLADEIVFLLEGKIYFKGSVSSLLQEYGETKIENAIASILINQHNH